MVDTDYARCLTDRLANRLAHRLTHRLAHRLTHRLALCLAQQCARPLSQHRPDVECSSELDSECYSQRGTDS